MSTGMQDKCRSSLNNLLWLFFTAACIRDMSCFQIDRRVTSKSILPYPSADRFSNPRKPLCMFIYTSCNKYSAKCSGFGSCCRCECRGHTPNFLSSTTGCVNAYSLGTKRETSCIYLLKNSGEMYVPTFTSYTDFQVNNITLQISPHSLHSVLHDGSCKAHSVHYIDRRGRKRLLFKNDCSEIFEIEKQVNEDKEVEQLLKWKVTLNPSRYFHKMQGKLLRLGISCEIAGKRTDSCLLFKVGGSYNDNLNYHAVESPRVCPTRKLFTPTKTTTSKETTKSMVKKTTVAKPLTQRLKPEEPITASSNSVETERPLVQYTTDPTSGIQPPASLPDVETTGPDTIETAASKEPSASDGLTDAPITTTWKQDKDEGSNTQVSKSSQSTNKRGINWLVTGLIIAVAILLVTLAASLFVLLRKRCTKRAQRNSGEFAMNVVYHGSPTSPEYDEATLPSKRDCEDDEVDCYADGNLYESIDNLNVKGATADAYEYAYKVNLPDENSNKEQPQPPTVSRPIKNDYEVAFRMKPEHFYNTPVVEEYEDMTLTTSEEAPLCTENRKYVNVRESLRESAGCDSESPANEVYEEMGTTEPQESEPLVSESYIAPDTISEKR